MNNLVGEIIFAIGDKILINAKLDRVVRIFMTSEVYKNVSIALS